MSRIPDQFIDELLNRIDIVEIIDTRVKLRKTGKNYSACCPFHKEKTPSFSVSPDKQFYYCFGCGVSGTALSFLMDYEHLGFLDAVDSLASTAGLTVPKEQETHKQKSNKNLYTVLEKAQQFYQDELKNNPKSKEAITYLKNRGLTGAISKQFSVGYAPPGWDNLLSKLGLTDEDRQLLADSGMITVNEDSGKRYDRFRHRIIFPIIDVRGRTIGFGGRILSSESEPLNADGKKRGGGPKYLNSPETDVFHKSRELYGLYQALKSERKLDHLLVVEGYMDVIALAQYGVNNAVATMGTACGEDHLKLGFRYTSQIIFCFDGDNAGRKAAKRALENSLPAMIDGRQIKFLFLPEGQDPDTLIRQIGAERFKEQLDNASPLETFFFESVAESIDVRTMEGRARMSKLAAPLLNKLPSGIYRALMFDHLAQRTGLSMDIIQELTDDNKASLSSDTEQKNQTQITHQHDDNLEQPAPPSNYDQHAPDYPEQFYSANDEESQEYEPYTHSEQPPATTINRIKLSPTRLATTILLEDPNILSNNDSNELEITLPENQNDTDLIQLKNLLNYLKGRPDAKLHTIAGHWAGHYGIEAQKQLTSLAENQFLGSAKRSTSYDSWKELTDALERIQQEHTLTLQNQELVTLSHLATLTNEQKQRMIELLQLKQRAKQATQQKK